MKAKTGASASHRDQWSVQVISGPDVLAQVFNGEGSALRARSAHSRWVRRMALARGQIDRVYLWEKDILVKSVSGEEARELIRDASRPTFAQTGQITKLPAFGRYLERQPEPQGVIRAADLGLGA